MAGEKGAADYVASFEKLTRVVHSGSQKKAILDLLVRELRRGFPAYNWVGVYAVEGEDLVLKAWSGPRPTQHVRIPMGRASAGSLRGPKRRSSSRMSRKIRGTS